MPKQACWGAPQGLHLPHTPLPLFAPGPQRRVTSIFGGDPKPPAGGNPDSNTLISDMTTVICLDDYHSLDREGRKREAVTALDPRAQNFDLMYEQVGPWEWTPLGTGVGVRGRRPGSGGTSAAGWQRGKRGGEEAASKGESGGVPAGAAAAAEAAAGTARQRSAGTAKRRAIPALAAWVRHPASQPLYSLRSLPPRAPLCDPSPLSRRSRP